MLLRFINYEGAFIEASVADRAVDISRGEPTATNSSSGFLPREAARRVIERRAVRAVSFRGDKLLMIHARGPGDYKFPGGGVEPGESALEALGRELREETGHELSSPGELILRLEERRPAKEVGAIFHMISDYYCCEVAAGPAGRQHLDDYEERLGFEAVWIDPVSALAANAALLELGETSPWIRRENFVLERLCSATTLTRYRRPKREA